MNIQKYIHQLNTCARKNAPTILTTLGIIGVASTAILAVKDSKKAEVLVCKRNQYKLDKYGEDLTTTEKVIAAFPAYLPTIVSGVTTVSCIYGANYINKNRQAMLLSAYGYLNNCLSEYKDAVTELYGEDADNKVVDHIIQNKEHKQITDLRDDEVLIYEEYSDTYITTSRNKIDISIANINRHFVTFGALSINNFLDFLDITEVEHGDTYGWSYYKNEELGIDTWIDITLIKVTTPDEYPLYKINWNIAPSVDYIEWHLF